MGIPAHGLVDRGHHRLDVRTQGGQGLDPVGPAVHRFAGEQESAAAGWGDALYMEGIGGPGVDAPPGADRQTRLLAALGRTA